MEKSRNGRVEQELSTCETTGWGGRIRTSAWRNQNPLPYRLATPQSAWVPALDLSGLFAGHKCGFEGNNGGTFQRCPQTAPKLAAEQTGKFGCICTQQFLFRWAPIRSKEKPARRRHSPVRCTNDPRSDEDKSQSPARAEYHVHPVDNRSLISPEHKSSVVKSPGAKAVDKATGGDRTRKFGFQLRRGAAKFTTSSREGCRSWGCKAAAAQKVALWHYTGRERFWCARPITAVAGSCPATTRTPSSSLLAILAGKHPSRKAIPFLLQAVNTRRRASCISAG